MMFLNILKTLFIPIGLYILLHLDTAAERFYSFTEKNLKSGMVTTKKWNKKVLIPISIVMIIYGCLNILLVMQNIRQY